MNDITKVDAIGLLCPLPVLRLRKRMEPLDAGSEVHLTATDPAAVIDVPHFCAEAGHLFLGMDEHNDHTVYRLRKG